ncbi:MAG: hypothetical protein ACKVN9_03480 [Methylophilaceae bacterium]
MKRIVRVPSFSAIVALRFAQQQSPIKTFEDRLYNNGWPLRCSQATGFYDYEDVMSRD